MNAHNEIHKLLEENRMIAHIWQVEDVQYVRPDLTKDQCWKVLQRVDAKKDAELGIHWETLRITAEWLFGYYDEEEE